MKRKIIKQGPVTLMVSLPSQWVKKFGIKKGEEINVFEKDKSLLITIEKEKVVGDIEVNIENPSLFLRRLFYVPYYLGYDTIKINYKDPAVAKLVRDAMDALMGFEMISEKEDHCVLKNIARGIEEEFDLLFNRMNIILIQFHKEILDAVKMNKIEEIHDVVKRDEQITKFVLFSKRMLNKIGYKEDVKTRGMYAYTTLIEITSDYLRKMCGELISNKNQINHDVIELIELMNEHNKLVFKSHKKPEAKILVEVKKIRDAAFEKISKEIVKKSIWNMFYSYAHSAINILHHTTEELI